MTILDLPCEQAKLFFMNNTSYTDIDLPKYFSFEKLLYDVDQAIWDKNLSDFFATSYNQQKNKNIPCSPKDYNDVNYKLLVNKDGLYAWRQFQLIHPAMYVAMVNYITEDENWKYICDKFTEFRQNNHIQCMSIPVIPTDTQKTQKSAQILSWLQNVEQESIKRSLEYSCLFTTDITDCYPSIYTHSLAWSLHGKPTAKANRRDPKLIGNQIDMFLQDMSFGQTNGIPQGSILMDFIAEIILGYIDSELSTRLVGIDDYHIIRYRDDYRIFIQNESAGEFIVKTLSEILIELSLKLNSSKTISTSKLITGSIKPGKFEWLISYHPSQDNQKRLLQIYAFAEAHRNDGYLKTLLSKYYKTLRVNPRKDNCNIMISIVADMAYNNPCIYPVSAAILSKLLNKIDSISDKEKILDSIIKKFSRKPNTGFMEIWLQRISYPFNSSREYTENLCHLVSGDNVSLWNSDWLKPSLGKLVDPQQIIDKTKLAKLSPVISNAEVDAFRLDYDDIPSNTGEESCL